MLLDHRFFFSFQLRVVSQETLIPIFAWLTYPNVFLFIQERSLCKFLSLFTAHITHMVLKQEYSKQTGQYHSGRWLGTLHHQVISSHNIDCVGPRGHCLPWSRTFTNSVSRNTTKCNYILMLPQKHIEHKKCEDEDKCQMALKKYHKTSSISLTKSHNLNVSCLVLQLPLPNPLKPGVKSGMKM